MGERCSGLIGLLTLCYANGAILLPVSLVSTSFRDSELGMETAFSKESAYSLSFFFALARLAGDKSRKNNGRFTTGVKNKKGGGGEVYDAFFRRASAPRLAFS